MIILGIDPGSRVTGYGVISVEADRKQVLSYGVIKISASLSQPARLVRIYNELLGILDQTHPDFCAIEMPIYARNPQSLLKLARAQAAAILAAMNREIPVVEYTPKEIKKAVTGNGNASKTQVWYMVRQILAINEDRGHDASDALATGLCHMNRFPSGSLGTPPPRTWSAFVSANPDRIRS